MRLEGKVVLVTASTRGIGYAIVERCAKEGAIVYMAARNMDLANEKAAALVEKGYKVKPVFNDAYDYESYKTMVDEVVKNEGHIDVLVNNFGTSNPKKDRAISNTEFESPKTSLPGIFTSTVSVPFLVGSDLPRTISFSLDAELAAAIETFVAGIRTP